MKNFYSIFLTELLFLIIYGAKNNNFFPNLPAGEYKINYIAAIRSNQSTECNIKFDHYFYKVSRNKSELRGNTTFKTPLDDSYTLHLNFAVKDTIAGWKDNAIVISNPNACSFAMKLGGKVWENFVYIMLGLNDTKCPLPAGHYVSTGYDMTDFTTSSNFPKIMFYGTYKTHLYFTDKKKNRCGGIAYIVDLLRPWENV